MRILVTSVGSPLGTMVANHLNEAHWVRATDRTPVSGPWEFERSDLGHDTATNLLVRGMDAIVHLGQVSPDADPQDSLDFQTRCTYNLLRAASEEKVPRFIYLSSLAIMERHDPGYAVTERWRPAPSTSISTLCYHLGEYVCREFAREGLITVICLRFGDLVWDAKLGTKVSSSALHVRDALHALDAALTAQVERWNVFHIQSPVPNARFLITTAEKGLGYKPSLKG
jgi:uronate dehydrogenase